MKSPRDLANRMRHQKYDGYIRETFTLPRLQAREKAAELFRRYPKQAYMSEVESWRALPEGKIEFTVRRLKSAD